ncbi:hypothetical protein PABG_11577 [Paracoccidioides brasiliensis Pb03]|nr:hypothetical protein PABG_11577 [Paracoccidioides brasiliensis Pb03]
MAQIRAVEELRKAQLRILKICSRQDDSIIMSKPLFSTIQNLPSDNTIFIIGSGIVALARYLGKSTSSSN